MERREGNGGRAKGQHTLPIRKIANEKKEEEKEMVKPEIRGERRKAQTMKHKGEKFKLTGL